MGLSSSVAFGATFSAGEGWVLTVRHGYKPRRLLSQAFPKEGKVVVVPVRKDGSAAKPSRRSDEYAFQPHPPPYNLSCTLELRKKLAGHFSVL